MLNGTSKHREVMLYTGDRGNSGRPLAGSVTEVNSFKKTVLSVVRPGRNVGRVSVSPTVVIQEVSGPLNPNFILRARGNPLVVPSRAPQARESGAKGWGGSPVPSPSRMAPQSEVCSICLSLQGDSKGCRNLGARLLACQKANCLHILQE